MKRRFVQALQAAFPGFFTEPMPVIPEPAKLLEHKQRANARTIAAHAKNAEPIIISGIKPSGHYAVLDAKRKVLIAHVSYDYAKDYAKKYSVEHRISAIVHKMA